jgi:lipid II isoglutaminyl synthase (glutamine-hydrolysing)
MQAATEGIVTNARDILLNKLAKKIASEKTVHLKFFGAADSLGKFFPDDYELAAVSGSVKQRASPTPGGVEVELADFKGQSVSYRIAGKLYRSKLKLTGQHNFLNGAAALALCGQLLPKAETKDLIADLSKVTIAFGRGELYRFENGSTVELVLVKNPASFSQALASYGAGKEDLMIAINDNIADGRDVSWLWDVNFEPLHGRRVELVSGTRAADMALRLSYDGINTKETQPQLPKALRQLTGRPGKKVILATYTAMLQLYKILGKQAEKIS